MHFNSIALTKISLHCAIFFLHYTIIHPKFRSLLHIVTKENFVTSVIFIDCNIASLLTFKVSTHSLYLIFFLFFFFFFFRSQNFHFGEYWSFSEIFLKQWNFLIWKKTNYKKKKKKPFFFFFFQLWNTVSDIQRSTGIIPFVFIDNSKINSPFLRGTSFARPKHCICQINNR